MVWGTIGVVTLAALLAPLLDDTPCAGQRRSSSRTFITGHGVWGRGVPRLGWHFTTGAVTGALLAQAKHVLTRTNFPIVKHPRIHFFPSSDALHDLNGATLDALCAMRLLRRHHTSQRSPAADRQRLDQLQRSETTLAWQNLVGKRPISDKVGTQRGWSTFILDKHCPPYSGLWAIHIHTNMHWRTRNPVANLHTAFRSH